MQVSINYISGKIRKYIFFLIDFSDLKITNSIPIATKKIKWKTRFEMYKLPYSSLKSNILKIEILTNLSQNLNCSGEVQKKKKKLFH